MLLLAQGNLLVSVTFQNRLPPIALSAGSVLVVRLSQHLAAFRAFSWALSPSRGRRCCDPHMPLVGGVWLGTLGPLTSDPFFV